MFKDLQKLKSLILILILVLFVVAIVRIGVLTMANTVQIGECNSYDVVNIASIQKSDVDKVVLIKGVITEIDKNNMKIGKVIVNSYANATTSLFSKAAVGKTATIYGRIRQVTNDTVVLDPVVEKTRYNNTFIPVIIPAYR